MLFRSIGIITDVHGEYHTYINLLRANGIIDKNLQWNFGTGHLVVIGDVFDRGQMVTEILWHLFGLEKEAERSGGRVHLMLGNHELMVLSNELDYINEKYNKVELISGIKYSDLFSGNSVLGIWLRSKPVMITINKILFVHAGISMEMIYRNLGISRVNRLFSTRILANERTAVSKNEELAFLNGNNGPLWYRGYFEDSSFCESKIDSILNFYRTDHIVVGHTPAKRARSFFNNKILGIDTGIMYELPGEILIYKNGSFFKCCPRGSRTKL